MADTPPEGETVTPAPLPNDGTPVATNPVNVTDPAEVERLRKEAEQARMRANQAQNELDRLKADAEEAQKKQLEEQQEFKQLYEKTNSELQAIRDSQAAQQRDAELKTATQDMLKDYPAEVVKAAEIAGLGLSDDGEAAKASLKDKLEALKATVAPNGTPVNSSNPAPAAPAAQGEQQGLGKPRIIGEDSGAIVRDTANPDKVHEYLKDNPGILRMKQDAGYTPRT